MLLKHEGARLALGLLLFAGALACRTTDTFLAQATAIPTRTVRPTFTPLPPPTNTPIPPTATATLKPTVKPTVPPTKKPPTATPKPVAQPTAVPLPPVSRYEFHVNPPTRPGPPISDGQPGCVHGAQTELKGTVYNDSNNPGDRYAGAIVALGSPDGSAIYTKVTTDSNGEYSLILSGQYEPGKVGDWGLWLVTPSDQRKSDIGGPVHTNNLPAEDPNSCWMSIIDFWK